MSETLLDEQVPVCPTCGRRTGRPPMGRRIRRARRRRGLTQAQLADRLGISAPQVTVWETGYRRPSLKSIYRIAKALDVDVAVLLGID